MKILGVIDESSIRYGPADFDPLSSVFRRSVMCVCDVCVCVYVIRDTSRVLLCS
jgi:hypothetical protein